MESMRVAYILYAHFSAKQPVETFREYAEPLGELLAAEQHQGLLFLFYDAGWYQLLNTVGVNFNPTSFADEVVNSRNVKNRLTRIINDTPKLKGRVRIITAVDLAQIVNNLRGDRAGADAMRLRRFLVADAEKPFYDTTKVVEAIIRIRNLGSGLPVFRIDWDALFNQVTLAANAVRAKYALSIACEQHQFCHKDSQMSSFVFSGTYTIEDLDKAYLEWDAKSWLNGFATRVFPGLAATRELFEVEYVEDDPKRPPEELAEDSRRVLDKVSSAILSSTLVEYYGLDPMATNPPQTAREGTADDERPKGGLTTIGSNPTGSVVSGALLCLSDGAILDLPPFSNYRTNVMWIDDHLKYALHRELSHLSVAPITVAGDGNRQIKARVPECDVYKDRADVGKVWRYTLGTYLPSLLRGSIMDSWIQPDSRLNLRHVAENRPEPGVLPRALETALRRGIVDADLAREVADEMWATALRRIVEVRQLWKDLYADGVPTMASLWITEAVKEKLREFSEDSNPTLAEAAKRLLEQPDEKLDDPEDWLGWGVASSNNDPPSYDRAGAEQYLTGPAFRDLETLIEDTRTYIAWVLEWPRFVQSVRAIRPRTLPIDVQWRDDRQQASPATADT